MPTQIQLDSLEKVVLKCLVLADKSPNIALILDIEPDDALRARQAIEKLKKFEQ